MKRILWCGIILLTVILDQVSKYLTVLYLKPIGDLPLIEGWLHLTYVENRGAAFGMLQNHRIFFLVFSTVGIALLLALLLVKGRELSAFGSVAVCLIIGGGIGNQIDRLVQGYVVDMIYVKIIDFAVFNHVVGNDIVSVLGDFQGVAVLSQNFGGDLQDFSVGGGGGGDGDGLVVGSVAAAGGQGQGQNQGQSDSDDLFHNLFSFDLNHDAERTSNYDGDCHASVITGSQ